MSKRPLSVAVLAASLLVGVAHSGASVAQCVPVQGKITNNFIAGGGTLGVVAMVYGPQSRSIKLKCAMVGVAQQVATPSDVHFIHSISCDDAIPLPAYDGAGVVPVHSSIVLNSTGIMLPPQNDLQLFTFRETSVPIVGVGARGLFFGVTGGQLLVEGAVYKSPVEGVPGSIEMKFAGEACYGG
jgi:hypothetical protein